MKDVKLKGHIPACLRHGAIVPGIYNSKYDSYYCEICNRWLEDPCDCGGNDCYWYPNRPPKPLFIEVPSENRINLEP